MTTILKNKPDTNVSDVERWASLVGGAGLMAYALARRDKASPALAALGGVLAWRGANGHCPMYQTLGINNAGRGYEKGTGARGGVPYELGIRVDQEVRIRKSPEELFHFWRNLENLPRFMQHLDSVRDMGNGRSHWVARGPMGMKVEWDAEIVNEIENSLIGWRSLPGSQVDNGGSVRFEADGSNATVVRVSLQYNPPAGSVGAMLARAFGEDPRQTIREDLQRFKELMETGAITTSARSGRADAGRWTDRERPSTRRDNVGDASEESFPASDAPSWTPEAL